MDRDQMYLEHQRMIFNFSRKYANKYFLDFMEVESIALEIFCRTCNKFDKSLNVKFSTFLFSELRKLNNYCKTLYQQRKRLIDLNDVLDNILFYQPINYTIFYDSINSELTENAKIMILDILSGDLLNEIKTGKSVFTKKTAMQKYKLNFYQINDIFQEIKNWWLNYQFDQFEYA